MNEFGFLPSIGTKLWKILNHSQPDNSLSYRFQVQIMVLSFKEKQKMKLKFGQTLLDTCTIKQCKLKYQNVYPCALMNLTILLLMRKEAGYFMSISLSNSCLKNIPNTEICQPKSLIHIASKQSVYFGVITGW